MHVQALLAMNELSNVPFAVLGNKLDAPGAVSEEEFRESMGLTQTYGPTRNDSDARPIEVFMCSVVHRFGYSEGTAELCPSFPGHTVHHIQHLWILSIRLKRLKDKKSLTSNFSLLMPAAFNWLSQFL